MAPRDSGTRMARRIRASAATEPLVTAWCFRSANGRKGQKARIAAIDPAYDWKQKSCGQGFDKTPQIGCERHSLILDLLRRSVAGHFASFGLLGSIWRPRRGASMRADRLKSSGANLTATTPVVGHTAAARSKTSVG